MEGPRPPHETEFPSVVKFLDTNLRPKEGWSITTEYPVAFSESNRLNIRIITERDQVLAHALIRPMILKAPSGLFKVAGLGSVVTSTEHRNQGLSTKTIQSCLEAAQAQGCDFSILWTNLYDFYRKLDFELAGSEVSALIDQDIPVADPTLKFLEGPKVSPEAIHRLYSQHTVTSIRTVEEVRKYLQIPNSRVYTAWDTAGQLKAYAIEGKGADLNGYVHEWGGSAPALMSLFAHIRKTQQRTITVIVPQHAQNLLRALKTQGIAINHGYLGMIKVLNHESLFGKIRRYARALGVADLVLEKQGEKFLIGASDRIFSTDSERDIVKLIFGPQNASEIHHFGTEAAAKLERVFPLHFWIWGWDSI
jgi:predicted GNAT family N-acyltransferase